MCLLLAGCGVVADYPLVVLGNRDEYWDRAAEGPAARGGDPAVVCGLDLQAGGTWGGMNAAGVVAVLTNRPGPQDPTRPSRGAIVRKALEARSSDTGAAKAAALAVRERPNPFSLFVGDEHGGVVLLWDGPDAAPDVRALAPGWHTLTNQHDLDELDPAVVLRAGAGTPLQIAGASTLDHVVAEFQRLAPGHTPLDGTRTAVCVHHDAHRRGTVSSAILAVDAAGRPARYLATEGAPCVTPWRDISVPE